MRPGSMWYLVVAVCLLLAASWSCATAQEAPSIDKETLKSWLADPMVVIIDVRSDKDWQGSGKKIKGAVREDPKEVLTWGASFPRDKKTVLYCAWPNEGTSARVARELLVMGFPRVWVLKGGWKEWESAGYPTEPK